MDDIGALSREFDPVPLDGDDERYVDWQRTSGSHDPDARAGLVREFSRNATPERPITRLLTGHQGTGKTTELARIASELRAGVNGRRIFVSTLRAKQWLDVDDVRSEDIVLQLVRQLVSDLRDVDVRPKGSRFPELLHDMLKSVKSVRLESFRIGAKPLEFSFARKDFPDDARDEFRGVLRDRLPTLYDHVNNELLPEVRQQLRARGYDDVLVVVDELDRMPVKPGEPMSNQERLFLQDAATLRGAIRCSLLITIPIDLAYSQAAVRLRNEYGAAPATVPLVSIERGGAVGPGEQALIEIVGLRAMKALGTGNSPTDSARRLFTDGDLLLRVVRLSGGHVRGLLVMLRELLNWVDEIPIGSATVDRYAARSRKELFRGLSARDHEILEAVRRDGGVVDDERFRRLLRSQYVFAYDTGDEERYGVNPLLGEAHA